MTLFIQILLVSNFIFLAFVMAISNEKNLINTLFRIQLFPLIILTVIMSITMFGFSFNTDLVKPKLLTAVYIQIVINLFIMLWFFKISKWKTAFKMFVYGFIAANLFALGMSTGFIS